MRVNLYLLNLGVLALLREKTAEDGVYHLLVVIFPFIVPNDNGCEFINAVI